MHVSVTEEAWEYIKDITPHKRRRPEIVFNGTGFTTIEHDQHAKGIGTFLLSFLKKPSNSVDFENYSTSIIYGVHPIRPETFVDTRPIEIQEIDYQLAKPGEPLPPAALISLLFTKRDPNLQVEYTMWGTGAATPNIPRHIAFTPIDRGIVLAITSDIVDYWHISTDSGKLPRSPTQKFGAFLNALGLRYLDHPLLHPTIPDNPLFKREAAYLAKMYADKEKRAKKR